MPKSHARRMSTCHPERPNYGHGLCPSCCKRRRRELRPDLAEKWRATARARWHAKKTPSDLEVMRVNYLRREFGITPEDYDAMYEAQDGRCKLCGMYKPARTKHGLHVDHDHNSTRVRGLLCGPCNRKLGFVEKFEAEKEWLMSAKRYLGISNA